MTTSNLDALASICETILEIPLTDQNAGEILARSARAQALATVELAKAEQLRGLLAAIQLDDVFRANNSRGMVLGDGLRGVVEHDARVLIAQIVRKDTHE